MNNIGIFSGGGLRAAESETGMLMALAEAGFTLRKGRGASAGALVSGMYFSGFEPHGLKDLLRSTPSSDLISFSMMSLVPFFKTPYLYNCDGLYEFIDKHIDEASVAANIEVSATKLDPKNKLDIMQESVMFPGSCWSIKASEMFPEVLPPMADSAGGLYGDGGVFNNIPMIRFIDASQYDNIFVFICNNGDPIDITGPKLKRAFAWLDRAMGREVFDVKYDWDGIPNVCVLQPPEFDSGLLSWSKDYKLIDFAYDYAKEALKDYCKRKDKVVRSTGQLSYK